MSERLAQLTKLYHIDPSDPFISYGIALEHSKAGRFEEALQWLDKTLAIDPHYCYAFYQKAKAYSEMGEEEKARQVLHEGIRTAQGISNNPDAAHAAAEMQTLMETL